MGAGDIFQRLEMLGPVHFTFRIPPDSLIIGSAWQPPISMAVAVDLVFPSRIRSLALMEFSPQQDDALKAVATWL
ncbi:hypothetical protein, partial [Mesorhizobium sp.]|uniref:hypothetical protein n=1 Tax=Mesorhizobium sp. TaxID=1871066 RepID=UPI0025C53E8E